MVTSLIFIYLYVETIRIMKLIDLVPLKEAVPKSDKKSLMGIGNYDTQGERDFNKHHGGSMYGDFMGNIADTDTTEFDDEEKDRNPGKVEPYNPKKDKIDRGYEPVNSPHINEKEMKLSNIVKEMDNPCWKGYEMVGTKKKDGKEVPNCVPIKEAEENEPIEYDVENGEDMKEFIQFMREYTQYLAEASCDCVYEAEYQGRNVKLGKPMQGDVKKFKVYVKNDKGNVVKVNFGDPNMRIKKSNPERRKSFRARHNCDTPGPRWKARYWSCRKW